MSHPGTSPRRHSIDMETNTMMTRFLPILTVALWALSAPRTLFAASLMAPVAVHVSRPAPDTVRTGQMVLVGQGAGANPAPDTVRTGQMVLVGQGAVASPAPDTVRTGQMVLVGQGAGANPAPDTVRTGQMVLVGKPQIAAAPDTVRTGQLVLVGKAKRGVARNKTGKEPRLPVGRGL